LAYFAIVLSATVHKTLPEVKQKIYGTFIECSYGALEIVLHSKEIQWKEKIIATLSREEEIEKRAALEASVGSAMSLSFPQIVLMTTLIVGAVLVNAKLIEAITIAIVPLAAAALFEAIAPLFFLGSRIHKTAASVDRLEMESSSPRLKSGATNQFDPTGSVPVFTKMMKFTIRPRVHPRIKIHCQITSISIQ